MVMVLQGCARCGGPLSLEQEDSIAWWHCVGCGRDYWGDGFAPEVKRRRREAPRNLMCWDESPPYQGGESFWLGE